MARLGVFLTDYFLCLIFFKGHASAPVFETSESGQSVSTGNEYEPAAWQPGQSSSKVKWRLLNEIIKFMYLLYKTIAIDVSGQMETEWDIKGFFCTDKL